MKNNLVNDSIYLALGNLKDLKDTDLSKILGLTVVINLKNENENENGNEEKPIIGMIYSLLKNNNFLICNFFIFIFNFYFIQMVFYLNKIKYYKKIQKKEIKFLVYLLILIK